MNEIKVLDHGYIKLIETWGSEERIIEAARMSTDKGFKGWGEPSCQHCGGRGYHETYSATVAAGYEHGRLECKECKGIMPKAGDEKLLRYLYEHAHHTPFEMAGMIIEVQAPIFVFREWHRHRTQSYNELSARYTQLPDLFYVPSTERITASAVKSKNKQASGGGGLVGVTPEQLQEFIITIQTSNRGCYETLLSAGLAPELARLVIPVSQYSRMRASANLRNWLGFLTLRMASGAQWEIRQYADTLYGIVKEKFPRTAELFKETL